MTPDRTRNFALFAALAGIASPVLAEIEFENKSGGSIFLYGQLDPAYLSFDDGVSKTSDIVDNTNSNSRVGLWWQQPFGANEFFFNFETALGLRPSAGLSQTRTPDGIDWRRVNIRKIDFSLKTEQMGRFYAGQGSMATDGVVHSDLSGTTLVTYASIPDTAASFRFRRADGTLSDRTIVGSFGDFDGGRLGRVRYDTPSFSGFKVSVAYGTDILIEGSDLKTADIALRYAGEFGAFKVKAAAGYARIKSGLIGTRNDTIGSFGMLHESGFNFSVAAGRRSGAGNYGYGKLGYLANWFSVGKTALAVDYYRGTDRTVAGARSSSVGVGMVQQFDRVKIDAYLGIRNYDLSEPGVSYRDASSVLFGARWRF